MSNKQNTIDWYNKNAKAYADHVKNPQESVYHAYYEKPAMYGSLPNLEGKSVISLGCGPGVDSQYLKNQGATRSVGIDISDAEIEIAQSEHPSCEFMLMDMEKLEFEDGSFDFAYSSLALHYLEDWTQVLQEVYRILSPGSQFIFSFGHPVTTAMDFSKSGDEKTWQLSVTRNKKTGTSVITGDYEHTRIAFGGPGEEPITWHQPLGKIFSSIFDAGFVVKDFIEPKPLAEMESISPASYQALLAVPDFLIIKVEKPV